MYQGFATHFTGKKKWLLIGVSSVVVALIVAFVIWVAFSYPKLLRSIRPGASASPSTSMKPYDIYLRTKIKVNKDGKTTYELKEWHLRLPRAYVLREGGIKGGVSNPYDHKVTEGFGSWLTPVFKPTTQSYLPETLAPKTIRYKQRILIQVGNGTSEALNSTEKCIKKDNYYEFLGIKRVRPPRCNPDKRILNCSVHMQFYGWQIKATMRKNWYNKPQKYCQLVRKFLTDYTVKIDDIRETNKN